MVDDFGPVREPERLDRLFRGWKAVAAAWALVLLVAIVLIAGHLFRSPPSSATTETPAQLGAVIPRHDPVCAGPQVPSAAPPTACPAAPAAGGVSYPDW
jgi:hypothetical protein